MDPLNTIRSLGVVPVIVIDDAADALPLATALAAGGLPCAEITFRTPAAEDALRRIAEERPDILVGAGTVLTQHQAAVARHAGASFVVSPGFDRGVIDYCQKHDIPVFPGVCTPTEICQALEAGLSVLKLFPAEPMGGAAYLKAASAPFGSVEFIPTGGVNASNLATYLALGNVVACGGSWMAPKSWIAAKQFDRIEAESKRALEAARSAFAARGTHGRAA